MKKTHHKICPYCGEAFTTVIGYQKFCSKKCALAEELRRKSGRKKCVKCWKADKIEANSEERICNECKSRNTKRTLDTFSPEELLHYGKIQADKFLKERK